MSSLKKFSSLTGGNEQPEVHLELALKGGPDPTKFSLEKTYDRPLPPVDGGTKAWSAIAGGFLALFVQFGLGKFQEPPKPKTKFRWSATFDACLTSCWAEGPFRTPVRQGVPVIR